MAKVIAIANQKGGVAKTTTTQNLAVALALKGKKVLMIDFDSQASLTIAVGLEPEDYADSSIVNVLEDNKKREHKDISECITQTPDGKAWIVTSIIDLANLEWQLFGRINRETILARAIETIKDDFDFILIDCPPALGILTLNALACADGVIMPSSTKYLSYRGLTNLEDTIADIKEQINPGLEVYGVIATIHENKSKHNQILSLMLQNKPVIAVIKNLADADGGIYEGISVVEQASGSSIAGEYNRVAEMIINNHFPTLTSWKWYAETSENGGKEQNG